MIEILKAPDPLEEFSTECPCGAILGYRREDLTVDNRPCVVCPLCTRHIMHYESNKQQ